MGELTSTPHLTPGAVLNKITIPLGSSSTGGTPGSGPGSWGFKSSLPSHFWPVRSAVRTPASHVGNRGSIPLRATTSPYRGACAPCSAFGPLERRGESKGGSPAGGVSENASAERAFAGTPPREGPTPEPVGGVARASEGTPTRASTLRRVGFDSPTGYHTTLSGSMPCQARRAGKLSCFFPLTTASPSFTCMLISLRNPKRPGR